MPVRPLPKELVERLKKAAPMIERKLGRMVILDHRTRAFSNRWPDTAYPGGRVRELDISKNFSNIKLVIKRVHELADRSTEDLPVGMRAKKLSAEQVIRELKGKISAHNSEFPNQNYILLEPHAYAINENLVAMAKTNAPSLNEILESDLETERGRTFFEKISKKHNISKKQLDSEFWRMYYRAGFDPDNVLFLGMRKGKFVFMPLVDLY